MNYGLAIIDGLLTSVGGFKKGATSTLFSLRGENERKQWSEFFPPMPTPRGSVACVTTREALVVAGGLVEVSPVATVEVMNISTKQWTSASPLPVGYCSLSATVLGDRVYLGGGYISNKLMLPSKLVLTCSLPNLMPPTTHGSQLQAQFPTRNVQWIQICSLPVTQSTLVSFGGDLLAIGGENNSANPTSDVYRYNSHTNSWTLTSQMNDKRSFCLALTLSEDCLVVVGGYTVERKLLVLDFITATDRVEMLK